MYKKTITSYRSLFIYKENEENIIFKKINCKRHMILLRFQTFAKIYIGSSTRANKDSQEIVLSPNLNSSHKCTLQVLCAGIVLTGPSVMLSPLPEQLT